MINGVKIFIELNEVNAFWEGEMWGIVKVRCMEMLNSVFDFEILVRR
jgi:hypothetical protein